jgi:hypothetical protein
MWNWSVKSSNVSPVERLVTVAACAVTVMATTLESQLAAGAK